MTDYGDALTRPFWAAAEQGQLLLQRCTSCGHHQHYPRAFCLRCDGNVEWVEASGHGTVYSKTTVRWKYDPNFDPPYTVAIVELAEGPRFLTQIVDGEAEIGDPVMLRWSPRDKLPPLPFFRPTGGVRAAGQ